jgi:16S rRNA processing protein RimM
LEDLLKNERVFLNVRGTMIPYFIAHIRGGGETIVKLEDVDDRDAAIALQSRDILLQTQDILPDNEREFERDDDAKPKYAQLKGFVLTDRRLGEIGIIGEVLEMPQQEMAFLRYKNREVLIPLNSQFISTIDEKNQRVNMDLPEGLLDQ